MKFKYSSAFWIGVVRKIRDLPQDVRYHIVPFETDGFGKCHYIMYAGGRIYTYTKEGDIQGTYWGNGYIAKYTGMWCDPERVTEVVIIP